MKTPDTVEYNGHDCFQLTNGVITLLVARSMGPRILSLRFKDGENMFAELPDYVTDCPGTGKFHFYGGHRLWHAPEEPSRTYLPDDSPVEIVAVEDGLLVTQEIEKKTGLQKSIEVHLLDAAPKVGITHRLTNHGPGAVTCAPWAITQFKVGGVAVLPQSIHESGVLPNRTVALWPYTDPASPCVTWGRMYILLQARTESAFKIGFSNPRGWLAYWSNGVLFVKRAIYEADSTYYDFGSSSECYCNREFLELETLAPVSTILPGASACHVETWEIYGNVARPLDDKNVQSFVERSGLE